MMQTHGYAREYMQLGAKRFYASSRARFPEVFRRERD